MLFREPAVITANDPPLCCLLSPPLTIGIRDDQSNKYPQIVTLFDHFWDDLIAVALEYRLRRLPGYGAFSTDKTRDKVREQEGVFHVAVNGDMIAGFVVAVMTEQGAEQRLSVILALPGRITDLYVDSGDRREGVARQLMHMRPRMIWLNAAALP